MKSILKIIRMVSIPSMFLLAMFAASCGGGGGDGGGGGGGGESPPGISYTGLTGQATINENNAEDLAIGAFEGGRNGSTVGSLRAVQTEEGGYIGRPRELKVSQALEDSLRRLDFTSKSGRTALHAVSSESGTVYGDCGGSASYTITVDDQTGEFSGSFNFNSYCYMEVIISGDVTFSGQADPDTGDLVEFTSSFDNLTGTSGSDSFTLKGNISSDITGSQATLTIDMLMQDNSTGKVYWLEDCTMTLTEGANYIDLELSGKYYDPDYGYVTITTTTPFRIYDDDDWPSDGVLVITGNTGIAGGSTMAWVTALTSSFYQVDADTNGDGSYDWDSGVSPWSDVVELINPTLLTPSDGSTPTTDSLSFEWSSVVGASEYQTQVSTDSSFASTLIDETVTTTTYTPTIALSSSTYYWRVKAKDPYGNESGWSEVWSFIMDITPPTTPTVDPVTSPTNLSSQILSGTKEANSSIWINGTEVVALDAETIWSASVTLTVEGTNDFSITSKDAAGNESAGVTVAIVYDATPPTNPEVTITVNPDKTVTISWSTSSDSSGILEYRISRDTMPIARTTETSYTDMEVEPGSIVDYCVRAVDNAGNISDCAPQTANIPPGGIGAFNTQFQLIWPTGVGTIQDLKVADIDGDGNRDIVAFSKTRGENRYVLLAWGPISSGSTFLINEPPAEFTGTSELLADIDGDGRPEIIGHRMFGPGPMVLQWDETSETWTEIDQVWTEPNVSNSAFADMDVDGILDMLGVTGGSVLIYTGIGDGTFDSDGILATGITGGVSDIRISDINRDGKADVVFWDETDISVFSGLGSGAYLSTDTLPGFSNKYFRINYLVADVSGDGFPDLVYDDVPGSPRDIKVFINDGTGRFPDPAAATGIGNSWEFATGDLNGDAIPDLIIEKDGQFLDIWWSAGDGTFSAGPEFSVSYYDKILTTDIDRDGDVDILAYGSLGGASDDAEIRIFLNE